MAGAAVARPVPKRAGSDMTQPTISRGDHDGTRPLRVMLARQRDAGYSDGYAGAPPRSSESAYRQAYKHGQRAKAEGR